MMALKKTLITAAAATALVLGIAGPAQAYQFNADGTSDVSFQIGDKTFDTFTCNAVIGGGSTCADVSFFPLTDGQYGVTFNPGAYLNLAGPGSKDVLLEFHVFVTNGQALINDFSMNSNAAVSGTGQVFDTLDICKDQGCSQKIFGSALYSVPPPNGLDVPDFVLAGGPYSSVWIREDISTIVGQGGGAAQISAVTKIVTQVPEPATLALLGLGLAGMGFARRRKQA